MPEVEICSKCGSPFVVRREVVKTQSHSQVIVHPLYCSNPKCLYHDPAYRHYGWSITRDE